MTEVMILDDSWRDFASTVFAVFTDQTSHGKSPRAVRWAEDSENHVLMQKLIALATLRQQRELATLYSDRIGPFTRRRSHGCLVLQQLIQEAITPGSSMEVPRDCGSKDFVAYVDYIIKMFSESKDGATA